MGAPAECPICFDELDEGAVPTLSCGHRFHQRCLQRWLRSSASCPLCRRCELEPKANPDGLTVRLDGTQMWLKDGKLHRDGDKPALVWADNVIRVWYQHGKIHRIDKPAVIYINGMRQWWKEGKPHRDGDKPAVLWAFGARAWWRDGKRYRIDEHAFIDADGMQRWEA